jgi:hypothetical protein
VTWRLIIDEYEGKPDGSTVEAESFAEIAGVIRVLTFNTDTGHKRSIKGRVMQGERKWFNLRFADLTRLYWFEYCPPGAK